MKYTILIAPVTDGRPFEQTVSSKKGLLKEIGDKYGYVVENILDENGNEVMDEFEEYIQDEVH